MPGRIIRARRDPLNHPDRPYYALGLEGSANKFGAGVVLHNPDGTVEILSNIRHTYITPPGEGFQPGDTAKHHKEWALQVVRAAVKQGGIKIEDMECICYTKGGFILTTSVNKLTPIHLSVFRPWNGSSFTNYSPRSKNPRSHV
jgi:N6-L-threonylcarbamoyladenine synthase